MAKSSAFTVNRLPILKITTFVPSPISERMTVTFSLTGNNVLLSRSLLYGGCKGIARDAAAISHKVESYRAKGLTNRKFIGIA
jgi:hypothetical protein